jgi:hypothetical protein
MGARAPYIPALHCALPSFKLQFLGIHYQSSSGSGITRNRTEEKTSFDTQHTSFWGVIFGRCQQLEYTVGVASGKTSESNVTIFRNSSAANIRTLGSTGIEVQVFQVLSLFSATLSSRATSLATSPTLHQLARAWKETAVAQSRY